MKVKASARLAALVLAAVMVAGVVAGCSDPLKVSTKDEIAIGRQSSKELEKEYGLYHDSVAEARITKIGKHIASLTKRADLPWSFKILNTKEVNALAVPGGFIYVTRGLMKDLGGDDQELAGVLGHEIAHVVRRHSAKMIEKETKIALAAGILLQGQSKAVILGANIANTLVMRGYSRKDEYEADKYGTIFASRAGYDPEGLLHFLEHLAEQEKSKPNTLERWMATHPPTKDRIARLKKQLGITH